MELKESCSYEDKVCMQMKIFNDFLCCLLLLLHLDPIKLRNTSQHQNFKQLQSMFNIHVLQVSYMSIISGVVSPLCQVSSWIWIISVCSYIGGNIFYLTFGNRDGIKECYVGYFRYFCRSILNLFFLKKVLYVKKCLCISHIFPISGYD